MSNFPSRSTHALRHLFIACAMFGLAAGAQAATTLETVKTEQQHPYRLCQRNPIRLYRNRRQGHR